MSFAKINLFGVYVAPILVLTVAVGLVFFLLRRLANRFGCCDTFGTPLCSSCGVHCCAVVDRDFARVLRSPMTEAEAKSKGGAKPRKTRDGTVRVDVVTIAPEVAGRIVELSVADSQFVRKGDLL